MSDVPARQQVPRLTVKARSLRAALRTLAKSSPVVSLAVVREEDGELVIEIGGTRVGVKARGTWLGRVRLNGEWMLNVWRYVPATGDLDVAYEGGFLKIGVIAVRAGWQDIAPETDIELPVNPTLRDLLCIPLAFTEAEIASCGLAPVVEGALARRRRLEDQVWNHLDALGVVREDVQDLVETALRRNVPEAWRNRS